MGAEMRDRLVEMGEHDIDRYDIKETLVWVGEWQERGVYRGV